GASPFILGDFGRPYPIFPRNRYSRSSGLGYRTRRDSRQTPLFTFGQLSWNRPIYYQKSSLDWKRRYVSSNDSRCAFIDPALALDDDGSGPLRAHRKPATRKNGGAWQTISGARSRIKQPGILCKTLRSRVERGH